MNYVSRWVAVAAALATGVLLYFGSGLHTIPALTWLAPIPVFVVAPRLRPGAVWLTAFMGWLLGLSNLARYLLGDLELPLVVLVFLVGLAAVFGLTVLFFRGLVVRGHPVAAVLNSDSPTLPPAYLVELAEALARPGDRAVLGPATDGGYYVLGLKAPHARLFEDVEWSTENVAEQTLARAREIGLPVHVLPPWYDVDDLASLP